MQYFGKYYRVGSYLQRWCNSNISNFAVSMSNVHYIHLENVLMKLIILHNHYTLIVEKSINVTFIFRNFFDAG